MFENVAARPDNNQKNQLTNLQEAAMVECWPGGPIVNKPSDCPPPSERALPVIDLFDSTKMTKA